MTDLPSHPIAHTLDAVYRNDSRRIFATLVRLLGDFDLAEEALHEAFAVAAERWPLDGVPANPRAWLVSTGRFKAVDLVRRRSRLNELQQDVAARVEAIESRNAARADGEIEDDRLRLIFTCCHPAIDPKVQVPLTLREVCGLTTEEIASAFLISPATMAQRIVRGKAKIRDAGIPFRVPEIDEMLERLDAVLSVIYLVFNEGYSASTGESLVRVELSEEAIRLARLVLELLPHADVMGLLALMLLHESRRTARVSLSGEIVLLADQDRMLWNRRLIDEGRALLQRAMATSPVCSYTVQAAISAVHAEAAGADDTDWDRIVGLYDLLITAEPSPVVELNRAVAMAMRDGPAAGLALLDVILERGELAEYHLAHAARGEFLRQLGKFDQAKAALERALELTGQATEREFLAGKLRELRP